MEEFSEGYEDARISDLLSELLNRKSGLAGLSGYSSNPGEIIEAARMVASGHTVLDQKVMSVLHRNARRLGNEIGSSDPKRAQFFEQYNKLTEREREICRLIQDGRSNREIAAVLHITEGTVKHYLSNIYGALGVRDRTALAVNLTRTAQSDS